MARSSAFWLTLLSALLLSHSEAQAQTGLRGWGDTVFDTAGNEGPMLAIAASGNHTLGLLASGELVMWGENGSGVCSPPALPPGVLCTAVSTAYDHAVAHRNDGDILAWGDNSQGQCSVPPPPPSLHYRAVAAGGMFTVAIRSDGSLAAWGKNTGGQCNVPAAPPGVTFVALAAGGAHTLALRSDGQVVAWGVNAFNCCVVPPPPTGLIYVGVAAGDRVSMVLRSDGTMHGWGYAGYQQLSVPTLPPNLSYTAMSFGGYHAIALRSDGSVVAWGNNAAGQCTVPPPPSGLFYTGVAAGDAHSVARLSDNSVVSWGRNYECQCNVPRTPPGVYYTQCAAGKFSPYDSSGPFASFVGLRSDGEIATWGNGVSAPPPPPGLSYVQVAHAYQHSSAVLSDGSIVSWGSPPIGQLAVPALPPGLTYVEVQCGYWYVFYQCGFGGGEWQVGYNVARRSDGSVIVWGEWPMGAPPDVDMTVPTLPPGRTYVQLSASGNEAAARQSDGVVTGWGVGGIGSPALQYGERWVEIAVAGGTALEYDCYGQYLGDQPHFLGRTTSGRVLAWGENYFGQSNAPTLPPGLSCVDVAAGLWHSLARLSDGSVVAWGDDSHFQCDVPPLPAGQVYLDVSAGTFESVARYGPAPACGSISRYCSPPMPNSSATQGATIEASGCPGIIANNLVLSVSGLPASTLGLFVYGSQLQQVPFGNGWSCVAGSVQGVLPPLMSSSAGAVSFPLDLNQYPFTGSGNPILAGSGWNFEYMYRDPTALPARFNFSDALYIAFAP